VFVGKGGRGSGKGARNKPCPTGASWTKGTGKGGGVKEEHYKRHREKGGSRGKDVDDPVNRNGS